MSYQVRTSVFEGPLDLLLQLVTRHQVDIADVRLVDIVAEYLSFLEEMRELDLEVTSEFLLIAATLIQLKARQLLPDDAGVDLDEELLLSEERDRLITRLLQCVTFKDVAAVLEHRLTANRRYVERTGGLDPGITPRPAVVRIPVDAVRLRDLAERLFAERPTEPDLDHLDLDLPSVELALDDLRRKMAEVASATFDEVVAHCRRRVEVVAYFLALLELARWGMVELAQPDWLSEITIRPVAGSAGEHAVSEWSR
jgi:segregation and condensation protein A